MMLTIILSFFVLLLDVTAFAPTYVTCIGAQIGREQNTILTSTPTRNEAEYDAIVIGSGMSGLCAGNKLAQQGKRVLMVEAHSIPGGYTTNFYRRGFRFEISTHVMNGCGPDDAIGKILSDFGCYDKIKFKKLDTFFRWKDPNRGIDENIPIGIEAYVDTLCNMYPHEAAGIQEFHRKYYPIAAWVVEFEKRRGLNKMLYAVINLPIIIRLLALRRRTAADILDSFVDDPKVRELLALPANLFGLHYSELDAAVFIMASLLFHVPDSSAYYPIGGSGKLSKILARCFCDNGGELCLQTHVEGIKFNDNGTAAGVIMKDKKGEFTTKAAKCIINCSDLSALVDKLCPEGTFPESFVKKVHKHIPGRSLVASWVGLDFDLKDYGILDYEILHNNDMSEQMRDKKLIEEITRTADYSVLPTSIATIYSNIDPSCCRPGKSVISTSFIASYDAFTKTLEKGGRRGSEYNELKDRIEEQLIEHMSRATGIADLTEHIEVIETATPLTFKRYTDNSSGSFMGWMATPSQGAFSSFSSRTPISNLFLCGQWLGIGGVQSVMVSGVEAANIALRYLARLEGEQINKQQVQPALLLSS